MTASVQVSKASKIFNRGKPNQVDALVEVDLTVAPGEFVSLIGPSGCGKSTLLRLIADLIEPTSGTVMVNGKPAARARKDQDYGMAFQQSGLFEWRTVAKNIELPLELKGWDRARRRARSAEMLELVENAHAAVYYAAWALDAGAPDAALAASVAKSTVNVAARRVCGEAIQVHGGIGFTWEYDLHLYFKRAKHLEPLYGDTEYHRERVLQEALAGRVAGSV